MRIFRLIVALRRMRFRKWSLRRRRRGVLSGFCINKSETLTIIKNPRENSLRGFFVVDIFKTPNRDVIVQYLRLKIRSTSPTR